jgi:hypothetical protein
MKLSRKLVAAAVLPFAFALAGCQTAGKTTKAPAAETVQAEAALQVYQASTTAVQGFRPAKISEQQTIYISAAPVFTAANVTAYNVVADQDKNIYIALQLNEKAQAALKTVPQNHGFAVVAFNRATNQSEAVSFSGLRQGDEVFLFRVANEQVAGAIVQSVWPQATKPAEK